jgi:hypothetical protein
MVPECRRMASRSVVSVLVRFVVRVSLRLKAGPAGGHARHDRIAVQRPIDAPDLAWWEGGEVEFESPHLHQQGLVTDQALCLAEGRHRGVAWHAALVSAGTARVGTEATNFL